MASGSVGKECQGRILWHRSGEELRELADVALRHLERFVLGQLALRTEAGQHSPQPVEALVEHVHAPALPGVGRQAPLAHRLLGHVVAFAAVGAGLGRPGLGRGARAGK